MINEHLKALLKEAEEHMEKSLEWLQSELHAIRAGRAMPAMIDKIRVDYYGAQTPLNQIATIGAPQPDLLTVQPWDPGVLEAIEKSIMASNMGFNPSNDGAMIRIPVPPLSEERRRDLVKAAKSRSEEAKVGIRNIRRDAKDKMRKTSEAEHIPEDMQFEGGDQLQKLTDRFTSAVDSLSARKEEEIMEV